jgi:hypothetical protein
VKYHGKRLGRIDGIFTHDLDVDERYAFLTMTRVRASAERHQRLDVPVVVEYKPIIIGITAVEPVNVYIIDDKPSAGPGKLWIFWEVEFL